VFGTLLSCPGFEFDYEFGRYPAAVFDVDALGLGPLADLGGVRRARCGFTSAAGWPPVTGADSAASGHIACWGVSQLLECLAFRSISYSVPSNLVRTGQCHRPHCRRGHRRTEFVPSGP
jgi:hypothetical protein